MHCPHSGLQKLNRAQMSAGASCQSQQHINAHGHVQVCRVTSGKSASISSVKEVVPAQRGF